MVYPIIKPIDLKSRMIIKFKMDFGTNERNWVVLPVKESHLRNGINADKKGLHAFGGMWYGEDPVNIKCYGKIYSIEEDVYLVYADMNELTVKQIKELTD